MNNTERATVELIINGSQANASMRDLEAAARKVKSEMRGMLPGTPEFAAAANNLNRINSQLNDVRVEAGLTKSSFDKLKDTVKGVFIGTLGANLMEAGATKLFASIQNGIQVFKEFESSLRVLKSLTGLDGAGMDYLRESALKTSTQLGVTSVDVVDAYKLIAGAKPELLENKEALAAITKEAIILAKASGLDLPDASKRLVDALNQFNAPADEAGKYVNVLAEAARLSAAEVPDITSALLEFGPAANSAKVGIEGSVAAIETLAEKGLKGAEAGTKLRNVLLVLNAPEVLDKKALNYFAEYGVSMDVLKDKSLPLADRLKELSKIQADAGAISSVFGKENSIAAEILLTNTNRVAELTKALSKDGLNSAQEQATENTKTLSNQITRMGIAWDNVMAKQGAIGGFLGFIAEKVTNIIIGLDNFGSQMDLMFGGVATASQKTKEYLIDFGKTETGKPLQQFMSQFDKMSDTKFLDNIKANKESFIELMKKEGESVKDASSIFDAYESKRRRLYKSPKVVDSNASVDVVPALEISTPADKKDQDKKNNDSIKKLEESRKELKKLNDAYWKQEEKYFDDAIKEAEKYFDKKNALFLKNMRETWDKTKEFWNNELQARLDFNSLTAKTDKEKYNADLEKINVYYLEKLALVKKGSEQEKLLLAQQNNDISNLDNNYKLQQLETVKQTFDAMADIAASFANIESTNESNAQRRRDKNHETERAKLKQQLDSKLITQAQYDTQLNALNQKQENEQKALMKRQAERQKESALFISVIKTALAWIEAAIDWTKAPAAYLASAQTLIIAATPVPEFFDGGYTGKGGMLDKRGGFAAILHPNEYVVNAKAMQNPAVNQMVRAIETGKVNNENINSVTNTNNGNSNAKLELLLEQLLNNGVHAEMVFDDERMSKFNNKQNKKIIQDDLLSI